MYERPLRPDELMHFGIKGMKWGIRRFQNPDGTLTDLGKRRVAQGKGKIDKKTGIYLKVSRKERKRAERIKQQRIDNLAKAREKEKLAKNDKLKPSQMTDKQLDDRIARLKKEKDYQDLLNDTRGAAKGKTIVKKLLSEAGQDAGKKILSAAMIATGGAIVANILAGDDKESKIGSGAKAKMVWDQLTPKKK